MKHTLLLLLVLFVSNVLYAQSASDAIRRNPDAAADPDSSLGVIKRKARKGIDRASRLNNWKITLADSLNTHGTGAEAARANVNQKIDSVARLSFLEEKQGKVLDSLHRLGPVTKARKVKDKVTDAEAKATTTLSTPQNKVNEKLNLLSSQANGEGNLPASVHLPSADQNPLSRHIASKASLPSSSLSKLNTPLGKHLQEAKGALNSAHITTPRQLNKLGARHDLFKLRSDVSSITKLMNTTSRYRQAAQNSGDGGLPAIYRIEGAIVAKSPLKDVQAISQQQKQLEEELKAKAESAGNLEAYKKQTLAKAKEVAFKQLATQQAKLKETIGKVSIYQRRNRTVFNKVKVLPQGKPEAKKNMPLLERFIPGVTLQVQRPGAYWIDLTPSLRYRILPILSVGAGWNERFAFTDKRKMVSGYGLYGVRSFTELTFTKGLSLRLDVERMNAFVPIQRRQYDVGQRKWVWNYMGGLKKEFSFMRGVTGNVQFMYNLYDPKKTSPYLDRYNVRFGFEFPFKQNKIKTQKI